MSTRHRLFSHYVHITILFCSLIPVFCVSIRADDWPMWRHDASRSAVTQEKLPTELHLQWVRQFPIPKAAWPASQDKLQFDASYEPVVMGKTIFVPSMVSDSVTAFDTETGAEKWCFYANGPVRFAPVAYEGKVYFACDDGYLYCVSAKDGKLVWKFLGGPSERRVIGNDRLVSMWPARGGPVLYDGNIYFAAGIWPFMGIFIHAVDAETGEVIWTNSGSGSIYIKQQHYSPAFAGVAPQGYMVATDDKLLVSGGRTVPACYDRESGKFLYFHLSSRQFGKNAGGYSVMAAGNWFFNGGAMYQMKDGAGLLRVGRGVYTSEAAYYSQGNKLVAVRFPPDEIEKTDKRGKKLKRFVLNPFLKVTLNPAPESIFLKAGNCLYATRRNGTVMAIDLAQEKTAVVSWHSKVEGVPWSMLAADGKLFVVTREGRIYCFGAKKIEPIIYPEQKQELALTNDATTQKVREILKQTGVTDGYCLVMGIGSGRLIEELFLQSNMHIIAVDSDTDKVCALRKKLYNVVHPVKKASRVSILQGDPFSLMFPPYIASLIIPKNLQAAGLDPKKIATKHFFDLLRPYGGVMCISLPSAEHSSFIGWVDKAGLENAEVRCKGKFVLLQRVGPLLGSANWTHQYADSANSVCSGDRLVKAPLGLLWFGGPPNDPVLPRHGHGPSPQVIGGRLFIEGENMLRAVDVYTGRLLWEKTFPKIGWYFRHTAHHPGANKIGSNYVSLEDAVYVMSTRSCMVLDPGTGKTLTEFTLPPPENATNTPCWGSIRIWEDLLIATGSPISIAPEKKDKKSEKKPAPKLDLSSSADGDQDIDVLLGEKKELKKQQSAKVAMKDITGVTINSDYSSGSRTLVVMDRHRGNILWSRQACYNFRHNAIAVAAGKVFCIDKMSEQKMAMLRRRGLSTQHMPTLYALDVRTGKVLWQTDKNIFGTWLGYSNESDVLLQAGSRARDRAKDEAKNGMIAYRGKDGTILWKNLEIKYRGPCVLHHKKIITNGLRGYALDLLTGKRLTRIHPLTGARTAWGFLRYHGCNTAIASEYLLLFRSSAAGYFDLAHDSGTGNMGGFRSGCTSNLIPADGVLNAPDYTRTCTCSYQNQCSLAMIHMPEAEMWTFSTLKYAGKPVERVGINIGAPGDRMSKNGTLWLDYPVVGGPSPNIPIKIGGDKLEYFRHHASLVHGPGLTWIAASGVIGLNQVTLSLAKENTETRPCTVRLYFAEPRTGIKAGDRVFNVTVHNKELLRNFDIFREAGAARRIVMKEFKDIAVSNQLTVAFSAQSGKPLVCGIEIVRLDTKEERGGE